LTLFADRFYLELQRTGREGEERYIRGALVLAAEFDAPVVATNDVRFVSKGDFQAHEARVCIHEGMMLEDPKRPRRYSEQQYLKSPQEMEALFHDIPEALLNTVEIARRCSLELQLGKSVLPAYPVPDGSSVEDYLRSESTRGLAMRLEQLAQRPAAGRVISTEEYQSRLTIELGVICQMGFAGYFLIVADFIRWARENGVPVGPGRGSGAGSLVAYALGITDLDPLQYDLLFERFLNPERVSMPDFDVDFCMDGRDRVIEYVAERYGRDRVSQIITYGTMAAKAVVRDVARVFGMSYGFADSIAKLIPFELGITLKDALAKEEELRRRYQNEEETRSVIDMAMSLEGLVRNAGMHAGGVVIAPSVLTDFAPLFCDENGASVVTQFDKDDVEAAGLVKFDFLACARSPSSTGR
jgi:DNA polymerase-3 subunit alpha